jgi:hypothetical protein
MGVIVFNTLLNKKNKKKTAGLEATSMIRGRTCKKSLTLSVCVHACVSQLQWMMCKQETSGIYLNSELKHKDRSLEVKLYKRRVGITADLEFRLGELQHDEDGGGGDEK